MKYITIILLLLLSFIYTGCGTTGKGSLYREPSIQWRDVKIQRVAIVPNRLPLNLHDFEKWRKTNWEIIKNEFEYNGFEVIDYNTSVEAFERSGLPVEDTKSSRENSQPMLFSSAINALALTISEIAAVSVISKQISPALTWCELN